MRKESIGYVQLISAGVLISFFPIFVRLINNLDSYGIVFTRILLASALMGIFFLFKREFFQPLKYEVWKMIAFGGLHAFILLGYFTAIIYLPVATAVFLMYTFPVWIFLFSMLILREKPSSKEIIGLVIALIGITILFTPSIISGKNYIGLLIGLGAGIGAGLVYVLSQTFKKYDKVSLTFWQNVIALPFISVLLLFSSSKFHLISFKEIIILAIIGLNSVIPFILVFKAFGKLKANKAGVVMLLETIWPIILAIFFFKEVPSQGSIFAGILILIGAYFVTR